MTAFACALELQLQIGDCRVMCLQTAAIMEKLQQLEGRLAVARRTGKVQEVQGDMKFASDLAVANSITGPPAKKARIMYATAGLVGAFGLAKGSVPNK